MSTDLERGAVDEVAALLQKAGPGSLVHLVGAGGCGMSALGHLLLDLGHSVTGTDLVESEEIRQLQRRGARTQCRHAAALVRAGRPVLVVHSSAVRPDNPELQAARDLGIPTVRRAALLAALVGRQQPVCVAGMHGKTTTSALLAFALENLGAQPSFAVGALVPQLRRHGCFSQHPGHPPPFFVVEADESDGTLGLFRPEHAILLNVDAEHLDHFQGMDSVRSEFARFAAQTRGLKVYCRDDANLSGLLESRPGAVSYGFHPQADYRIESPIRAGAGGPERASSEPETGPAPRTFALWHAGSRLGVFGTQLLGGMNISNAAAVVALLVESGFDPAAISRAILPFRGAARRQQLLYADERTRIYDDYAHHPSEIRATLQAFRESRPTRLRVVFQPHRYTRTHHLLAEFATCFAGADELWLTEIYPASEAPIPGVSGARLAEAVRATGQAAHYVPELEPLGQAIRQAIQPGDLTLFLGAGDITKVAHGVADCLASAATPGPTGDGFCRAQCFHAGQGSDQPSPGAMLIAPVLALGQPALEAKAGWLPRGDAEGRTGEGFAG